MPLLQTARPLHSYHLKGLFFGRTNRAKIMKPANNHKLACHSPLKHHHALVPSGHVVRFRQVHSTRQTGTTKHQVGVPLRHRSGRRATDKNVAITVPVDVSRRGQRVPGVLQRQLPVKRVGQLCCRGGWGGWVRKSRQTRCRVGCSCRDMIGLPFRLRTPPAMPMPLFPQEKPSVIRTAQGYQAGGGGFVVSPPTFDNAAGCSFHAERFCFPRGALKKVVRNPGPGFGRQPRQHGVCAVLNLGSQTCHRVGTTYTVGRGAGREHGTARAVEESDSLCARGTFHRLFKSRISVLHITAVQMMPLAYTAD